jgi:hypothetical protein
LRRPWRSMSPFRNGQYRSTGRRSMFE